MRTLLYPLFMAALLTAAVRPAEAGGTVAAARELAEAALRKAGIVASREGTEALTKKIVSAGARYGDDVVEAAVKKVGPRALGLADDLAGVAADQGTRALKLMARHGDDAAVWVLGRPKAWSFVGRYGDEAAEALVRHRGVAEPLIEGLGRPGVAALNAVGPQSGRRLAMLVDGGELARIGRTDELLGVIGRYGDRACNFVWRNKAALAVGTTLTAFLAKPEPFLDGAGDVLATVGKEVVPATVGAVAQVAGHASWLLSVALVTTAALLGLVGLLAAKYRALRIALAAAAKLCLRRLGPAR